MMTNAYFNLGGSDFTQDWTDTGLITTDNDWSMVPSIRGFRTGDVTSATGVDARTIVTDTGFVEQVLANQSATATSGGVLEVGGTNPSIGMQGANGNDYAAIVLYLDSTGRDHVTFAANIRDLDASADDAIQQVVVQYRIGDTGNWTNIAYVADATTKSTATQVTPISVELPAEAANQAQLEIRVLTTNAAGNDELIGIDDIHVSSSAQGSAPQPGALSIAGATTAEGDSGTHNLDFAVTRSGGTSGEVSATWTVTFPGDANSADGSDLGTTTLTGTVTFADGASSATISLPVAGDTVHEANEHFTVTLSGPTGGATLGTATATGTITNDDYLHAAAPATTFVNEIHYDNTGADSGEAIEIAGAAGTDLAGWSLALYDGGTGNVYDTIALSGVIADQQGGHGTLSFARAGIQNGPNDGIALIDAEGHVVQFLSYEGVMTALSGPAEGYQSIDIGQIEAGTDPVGFTLQLQGTGSDSSDFSWAAPAQGSLGAVNTGQVFGDGSTPLPGALSIADAAAAEGDSGTTDMTFTVTRAGGSDGAVAATWTVTFPGGVDGANAGDFADGTVLTGTVEFADGATTATIHLPVAGDTAIEPDEHFMVTLSDPTGGATLGTATATGTIQDDDTPEAPVSVFINEIHYDNSGTDAGEAIEIAGTAGTDLTGWSLVLYNGGNGASYGTIALSGTIDDEQNGYGALAFDAVGLQNGSPDGVALVDNHGNVVQFLSYEGTMTATNGAANGMTSTDIGASEEPAPAPGYSLQLVGAGSSAADFSWALVSDDSFGTVNADQSFYSPTGPGHLRIADASVGEGDSGSTDLTFTVYRAGGIANAASVGYTVNLDGTADSSDLTGDAVLNGTVSFAAGETQKQIVVHVQGDTLPEHNETLSVDLSNPSDGFSIDDAHAVGTIVNDDPIALTIAEIQGAGHTSEYVGQQVSTSGIVTAVDTNGFYIQMAVGDGDAATSDAVFVFTSTAPTVAVGNAVDVGGIVSEYAGDTAGLTVTEITAPTVSVTSEHNDLPTALLIGQGGVLPPTQQLDDDHLTSYDPVHDGIDFWESLEGMLVTIDSPIAVSNTTSLGETDVVASHGEGATGMNDRGGITITPNGDGSVDYNPEKIQIDDDSGIFAGFTPGYTVGDELSSVTGIVNYSFDNYEVVVTQAVTVTKDVTLGDDDTVLHGDADHLSLATYNLENMDPSDQKYDVLAHDVVYSLGAPDILAVQEVQDADGAGTGSDLSGASNAQGLIDAIFAASGMHYVYVEIAPTATNISGGEPNGNIRSGYLYNADRVSLVEGSVETVTGSAYDGSRLPLAATWSFNGEQITTIDVHFTSRGGSEPLWGNDQPADNAGDAARTAQAGTALAYINNLLASDPNLNIALLGDFNGFYFEDAQTQLTQGGVLTNLNYLLPSEERYSYLFDGNAQQIDNIYVTGGLVTGASYDAVHINSQFTGDRPTDHDPQVSLIYMPGAAPTNLALSNASVDENQPAGTVVGTLSATDEGDTLTYSLTNDAGGLFVVDANTGVITTTAALDHEANDSFILTARATDALGHTVDRDFTVAVGNVNEAPVLTDPVETGIAKGVNDPAIALLEGVTLYDPDGIDISGGSFTIAVSGTGGAVALADGSGFSVSGGTIVETATGHVLGAVTGLGTDAVSVTGLTADATTEVVEALLHAFTYDVTGTAAAGDRTVTLSFSDGASQPLGDSVTQTVTIGYNSFAGTNAADIIGGSGISDFIAGGAGDDWIAGKSGDDRLDGGTGADRMDGGSGDDHYIVDNAGDTPLEKAGAGYDTVESSVSFSLAGQYLEALVLTGTDAINGAGNSLDNAITGNDAANVLTGLAGNDTLDGGKGADTLKGGVGDDLYIVDNAGDVVIENSGEGYDTVRSSVSFNLTGQFVEALVLTGTAAISGTGNALDNAITGNDAANLLTGGAGNDTLDGGKGADTLKGGVGDDVYVVDNAGDLVSELNGEGHDLVQSSVSFSLAGQFVEDLTLTGTAAINGTGNALNNHLIGNGAANTLVGGAGNDTLDGGAGADTLKGGTGDDTYVVDNSGDRVTELAGEGNDTVLSSVSFNLTGQYIETLKLIGSDAINAVGTSYAETFFGNGAKNVISAGGGDDAIHGGLGADTLTGGAGADSFFFDTAIGGGNVDQITDFAVGTDRIVLDSHVFTALSAGGFDPAMFAASATAQDADDHILYDSATGALYYDADGSGAGAAVRFAQLSAGLALSAADFQVI